MKKFVKIISLIIGFLLLAATLPTATSAQVNTPLPTISLAAKTSFLPSEPVKLQIDVANYNSSDVIARKGFWGQDFHLMITFIGPDGKPINTFYQRSSTEPLSGEQFEGRDAAFAEIIPPYNPNYPITKRTIVLEDARAFYNLTKYGRYTAQVLSSLETFSQATQDQDPTSPTYNELFAFLDDRIYGEGAKSNQIAFEIPSPTPTVKTSVEVMVNLLKIGTGAKPPTTKTPLGNVPVYLFLLSDLPPDYFPVNYKVYPLILENVPPIKTSITDSMGIARFEGVSKNDYIVIAYYDKSPDFKHMSSPIDIGSNDHAWASGQPIQVHLNVMEKVDGKKVPGKTTKKTGSELLITEPEFVLWDSTQELYPFVFETIGDWSVTTSVAPPEGFRTDYKSLGAEVYGETEAVQFTITDVGSKWEETEVTYKIKHKKVQETIKSKIGIKLSEKLAKEKGLGIYGHTESPGDFEGGRKVGKKK